MHGFSYPSEAVASESPSSGSGSLTRGETLGVHSLVVMAQARAYSEFPNGPG